MEPRYLDAEISYPLHCRYPHLHFSFSGIIIRSFQIRYLAHPEHSIEHLPIRSVLHKFLETYLLYRTEHACLNMSGCLEA